MMYAIRVCVDCVDYIANNHIASSEQYRSINWSWDGYTFELDSEESEAHFSWQKCEMCSNSDGGDRYMAFALEIDQ